MSQREAHVALRRWMDAKVDRISELRRLLERNGVALKPDETGLRFGQ
ncbi:hypothetical protein [Kribbella sp. NPDC049584]